MGVQLGERTTTRRAADGSGLGVEGVVEIAGDGNHATPYHRRSVSTGSILPGKS
jgi:hypothetical protein